MIIDDSIKSVLDLKNIIFSKIEFNRDAVAINAEKLTFKIRHGIKELDHKDEYEVALKVLIEDVEQKALRLLIEIKGYFKFDTVVRVKSNNVESIREIKKKVNKMDEVATWEDVKGYESIKFYSAFLS